MNRSFAYLATLIVAAVAVVYFVADESPADWLVRLSFAGALIAGLAVVVWIVCDLVDDRPRRAP